MTEQNNSLTHHIRDYAGGWIEIAATEHKWWFFKLNVTIFNEGNDVHITKTVYVKTKASKICEGFESGTSTVETICDTQYFQIVMWYDNSLLDTDDRLTDQHLQ